MAGLRGVAGSGFGRGSGGLSGGRAGRRVSRNVFGGLLGLGREARSAGRPGPWRACRRRRPCARTGMPWPLSRKIRPFWVPAGIRSRTLPFSVVTGTSRAEQRLAERDRQLALEVGAAAIEDRVGPDANDDDEVAAGRALAGELDARAAVGAARDRHLEALALDLDPAGRAVERLLERDLGDGLGGRRRRCGSRRPGPPLVRATDAAARRVRPRRHRCPCRGGCRRTSGRRLAAGRGRVRSDPSPRRRREEHPEEVGEVAAAGARRPELVADVAPAAAPGETRERIAGLARGAALRHRPGSSAPSSRRACRTSCASPDRRGRRWPR